MKKLTPKEEIIMQILWKLKKANVAEIMAEMPEPRRAYNTISTIVRILESKKFIDHIQQNQGYTYYPLVEKQAYCYDLLRELVDSYFDGSIKKMASFYIQRKIGQE